MHGERQRPVSDGSYLEMTLLGDGNDVVLDTETMYDARLALSEPGSKFGFPRKGQVGTTGTHLASVNYSSTTNRRNVAG
jgi:hypothetical protein